MNKFKLSIDKSQRLMSEDIENISKDVFDEKLSQILNADEGSAILQKNNDSYLMFGVQDDQAFVFYDPGSEGGNYLWLEGDDQNGAEEFLLFNIGGTESEISKNRCISKQKMKQAIEYYYLNGDLVDNNWTIDNG